MRGRIVTPRASVRSRSLQDHVQDPIEIIPGAVADRELAFFAAIAELHARAELSLEAGLDVAHVCRFALGRSLVCAVLAGGFRAAHERFGLAHAEATLH